jgi:hypothetical protein
MATTVEEIKEFLDTKEVKYLYDQQKEVFVISFAPNVLLVRLEENGEFLQFRTLNFYQYKTGKYKEGILQLLCALNYQRKLIKFGYDPEDGELNGCVDIPIEDCGLTARQFFRSMAALLEALEEARHRIMVLLETGKDPGPSSSKTIDSLVEEILDSIEDPKETKESAEPPTDDDESQHPS